MTIVTEEPPFFERVEGRTPYGNSIRRAVVDEANILVIGSA